MKPLGIGVTFVPGLEPLLEAGSGLLDVVEIEPQVALYPGTPVAMVMGILSEHLEIVRRHTTNVLVHSAIAPVGSTHGVDSDAADWLARIGDLCEPAWMSEHLSFHTVPDADGPIGAGFLMPPIQTDESVTVAVANLRRIREATGRPIAFETGVNYLRRRRGEMSDGEFWARIALEADCGIVLDLHNVWTNDRNGRESVVDVLDRLPLDRVWELHLAGGQELDGMWLDAHCGLVPPEVERLADDLVPELANVGAAIFEIMPAYLERGGLTADDLREQLHRLRRLWERRVDIAGREQAALPAGRWERLLVDRCRGAGTAASMHVDDDPGWAVLDQLVGSARRGSLVTILPRTMRLLGLALGAAGVEALVNDYLVLHPAGVFRGDEARAFGAHLRARSLPVPHLDAVLGLELLGAEPTARGTIAFRADPTAVFEALDDGRLPPAPDPEDRVWEVAIS